jgi:tetratricopeptide (TPR) repeat protein
MLYLLHLVLFIAADRYRIVLVPLLLLFAAHAVFVIADRLRAHDRKGLTAPLLGLAALLVFVNVGWYQTNRPSDWAKDFWSAGNRFNTLRKYDLAEVQMRKALKLYQKDADIWMGLGESLYYQKKFAEAAAAFSEGARRAADPSQLLYGLALCYVELGRIQEARNVLTDLLRQDQEYKLAQDLLRELDSSAKKP